VPGGNGTLSIEIVGKDHDESARIAPSAVRHIFVTSHSLCDSDDRHNLSESMCATLTQLLLAYVRNPKGSKESFGIHAHKASGRTNDSVFIAMAHCSSLSRLCVVCLCDGRGG
jgi:hypothetical protein